MQQVGDEEEIPVVVLMVNKGKTQSERELAAVQSLAGKYPEARAAVEAFGKPMDVADVKLAAQIRKEYRQMMKDESGKDAARNLKNYLKGKARDIEVSEELASLTVSASKQLILELEQRDDIGAIFLAAPEKMRPAMNAAACTVRAHQVWNRGFLGNGTNIGIMDVGNVSTSNTFLNLSSVKRTVNGNPSYIDHATKTASVAASTYISYQGIAPQATIISVGISGSEQDAINGLNWAADNGVSVLNVSGGFQYSPSLEYTDRAFDKYARDRNILVVLAAGNSGGYMISPAKAWNVITVGSFHDQNNCQWPDDANKMSLFSSYINPQSPNDDREKPEVVAVGEDVSMLTVNNQLDSDNGTSFSAPMVSGTAALLMSRNSQLMDWPEAVRAILMATAFHNIEGSASIIPGEEARDGAGAIDAGKADLTATTKCTTKTTPCGNRGWWGLSVLQTTPEINRYITAKAGKRVRVAIAWWALSDCTNVTNCSDSSDRLATDLDLYVYDPNGNIVSASTESGGDEEDGGYINGSVSASYDNNYELVDFNAPVTGTYRIRITKPRMEEYSNWVGVAFFSKN